VGYPPCGSQCQPTLPQGPANKLSAFLKMTGALAATRCLQSPEEVQACRAAGLTGGLWRRVPPHCLPERGRRIA
jgi:hypothetical protein